MSSDKAAPTPAPLTTDTFGDRGWAAPLNYDFARHLGVVPLAASEIGAIATQSQIFLTQSRDRWQVFAKVEAAKLEHLTVRPFLVNIYPFTALPRRGDWVLGVYDDPNCVHARGHPFFRDGAPAQTVVKLQQRITKFIAGLKHAATVAQTMATCGILEPAGSQDGDWSVWQVNEEKLATLDQSQLGALHRSGGLALAYAQVLSQFHARPSARRKDVAAPAKRPQDGFLDAVAEDMEDLNLAGIGALIE